MKNDCSPAYKYKIWLTGNKESSLPSLTLKLLDHDTYSIMTALIECFIKMLRYIITYPNYPSEHPLHFKYFYLNISIIIYSLTLCNQ